MDKDIFKGNWQIIKGKLKQKWAELTDDELLSIEGNHDEVFGVLQKRYGYAKDEVKQFIDDFND